MIWWGPVAAGGADGSSGCVAADAVPRAPPRDGRGRVARPGDAPHAERDSHARLRASAVADGVGHRVPPPVGPARGGRPACVGAHLPTVICHRDLPRVLRPDSTADGGRMPARPQIVDRGRDLVHASVVRPGGHQAGWREPALGPAAPNRAAAVRRRCRFTRSRRADDAASCSHGARQSEEVR